MKLYHIDRGATIRPNQILHLCNNIYFEEKNKENCLELSITPYKEGLSQHGLHYLLNNELSTNNVMPLSNVMDIVFEYERLLNYKDKLSRYQAFFAFDKKGIIEFIKNNNLRESFFKIYEVESDYYEKHNMALISGNAHYNISAMAKCYWENLIDPYNRPIINEYLLKYPVKIVKEIRLEDLEN